MAKGERIDLPRGVSLYYVDDDHSYWRCKPDGSRGQRLTGVTTVVKPLDFRPDNLMKWAANLNCDGVAELAAGAIDGTDPEQLPDVLDWLLTGDGIRAALEESERTWQHLRDKAGKRGTNIHVDVLVALAVGKKVPDLAKFTDEERGYAQGVMRFWREHRPTPTHIEQIVCDPDIGVAGRFDLRAKVAGRDGVGLIDLKTGGYISEGAHAQVALYDHLAGVCGVGETDWQAILRVDAEGGYELIDVQADHEDALLAVDVYRRAGRIGREARKARKSQREAVAAA